MSNEAAERLDLDELKRLLAGARDAPWQWLDGDGDEPDELQDGHGEFVAGGFTDDVLPDVTDGRLCAALRNAAPNLIAAAREAHERSAGAAPLDVELLEFALHEHYGEGNDDTCWHSHDAERVARIYERAVEYGHDGDAE